MANELQPLSLLFKTDFSEFRTIREAMLGSSHSLLIFGMI